MPPTATYQKIKAYQDDVEKNKITPHSLPLCATCRVDSKFFKVHAYRERCFLIIVEMIVRKILCPLIRFKCPGCGKTVTFYPDFAIPINVIPAGRSWGLPRLALRLRPPINRR